MKLDEFCNLLGDSLAALPSLDTRIEAAARYICQAFSVKPDEVAIFLLDPARESLTFLWPPKLKTSGAVPLNVSNSLVAQTAREKKGFVNNTFASTPHASIFELFRCSDSKDKPLPIQKIVSAPISRNGEVQGVIQLSRKGPDPVTAGRDFTQNELLALQKAGKIIAGYLD